MLSFRVVLLQSSYFFHLLHPSHSLPYLLPFFFFFLVEKHHFPQNLLLRWII